MTPQRAYESATANGVDFKPLVSDDMNLTYEIRRRQAEAIAGVIHAATKAVARVTGLGFVAHTLAQHNDYRRTLAELKRLDDRMLRDIGVARGELRATAIAWTMDGGKTATARVLEGFRAWRARRSTAAALKQLDNRTLADIGIDRGEIDFVARMLTTPGADVAKIAEETGAPVAQLADMLSTADLHRDASDLVRLPHNDTRDEHAKAA